MEHTQDSDRPDPGTPGIKEVRFEDSEGSKQKELRKVELRAEIDTSPPFESVKEAVTRFGGSGSWNPYYKGIGEVDIKKVEKLATELEKDLIVKELETLDVLEELGTTKGIVEELKQQIRKEALRRMDFVDDQMSSPAIKEMNTENCSLHVNGSYQRMLGTLSPCRSDLPGVMLMELKQAKMNLGKTSSDLGMIQSSVEFLNKKTMNGKSFFEKAIRSLTSKLAGVSSLEEELKQARVMPSAALNQETGHCTNQLKMMIQPESAEVSKAASANDLAKMNLKTAELRLFAARKMEEAARAAETVALAEINALSSNERSSTYILPEPEKLGSFELRSPLTPRTQKLEGVAEKKIENVKLQNHESNATKMSILMRLREATEEIKQSKQAIEEAMNKVEIVNRKQFAVEEAFCKWMPDGDQDSQTTYCTRKFSNLQFPQLEHHQDSPLNTAKDSNQANDGQRPVLRPTTSMRDVLSKKQNLAEEFITARPTEGRTDTQKVALSQMLHELRGDITIQPRPEKNRVDKKQYFTQRRKFGFIHIWLPTTKPSKRKDARY